MKLLLHGEGRCGIKKKQKQKKTSIVLGSIKLIYSKKRFDIQLM